MYSPYIRQHKKLEPLQDAVHERLGPPPNAGGSSQLHPGSLSQSQSGQALCPVEQVARKVYYQLELMKEYFYYWIADTWRSWSL